MKIKLLGQAGLQIDLKNGARILVDPYLTDTLREQKGERFLRQIPPPENAEAWNPDILLITHDHGDHLDMATLEYWLDGDRSLPILGPYPVFRAIADRWPSRHNCMVMRPGVEVSLSGACFCAVPAFHETMDAVGYLVKAEGKTVYISGDTLYSRQIPDFLKGERIDVALVCINGIGNNMNPTDAARLAEAIQPGMAIPIHWDMFSSLGADPRDFVSGLSGVPAKILRAYEEIHI